MHGFYPKLEGGDLLIIAGDITASDTVPQLKEFFDWFQAQKYRKKVLVGGNHDNFLSHSLSTYEGLRMGLIEHYNENDYEYLLDSGTEFEGLKIWGSPWTPWFSGVHPKCKAFMLSEKELEKKWKLIPENTDILITHGPPYACLDQNMDGEFCGSKSLDKRLSKVYLKYHVFGHIHEAYGQSYGPMNSQHLSINCSHVNFHYKPVNKPVRIEL
jgi:Icc-related predicted phosphoesterase